MWGRRQAGVLHGLGHGRGGEVVVVFILFDDILRDVNCGPVVALVLLVERDIVYQKPAKRFG